MGYGIMSNILEIQNVSKEYVNAEGNVLKVLDDINLTAERGSFVTILGPSGCGKTTLLKLIGGLELPSSGMILADGKPVEKPGIDRSMVFQTFDQLLPWKTVEKNVEYPLKVNRIGKDKEERREIIMEYLSMVGLEKFAKYYPHQISGGMKQRVAIARSLAQNPKIILMDEPFASIDAQGRNTLQEELYKLWKKTGVTIVFITHNIQEAIVLGSKIVVMSKSPSGITIDMENPVEASGEIRFPGSKGYDQCWKLLHDSISVSPKVKEN